MSLNESSSVVECQSDQLDSIRLTIASYSSTITLSSSSIVDSPLAVHEFTTERITRLLKTDSTIYKAIRNTNNKLLSVIQMIIFIFCGYVLEVVDNKIMK
jgi:hypothetical protein